MFSEKELTKSGQLKENTEMQYSKITELEERYHHKMHVAKVSVFLKYTTGAVWFTKLL